MNSSVTHRTRRTVAALALGMTTALTAVAAQADPPTVVAAKFHESVVVRYDDLNLATAAGAQALYARISAAADRACGGAPDIRELRQHQSYRTCVDESVERAVKKVDNARLQALHAERRPTQSVG